jgi:hypothetical protein
MWRRARNDDSTMSLRGARFLAYASEQAPQSLGGMRLPRTFQVLAMTKKEGLAMTKRGGGDKPRPDKSM